MYAQDNILCQFGLIICHSPTYSFLHQFSTILGGNCINLEEEHPTVHTTMSSGHVSKPPACLIEGISEAALTAAELNYYFALSELLVENEFGCVGAGIGSGIDHTNKLMVLSLKKQSIP